MIAGTTADLAKNFSLTPEWLGITVSAALWGTLLGAIFTGKLGDRLGSRDTLKLLGVFYLIAGLGCAFAWDWGSFVVFRFICGIAIGGTSVLAPVYISEISPPERRGRLVGMFQINIILGILIAYVSNAVVRELAPQDIAWRWMLGVSVLPAIIFTALLFKIPNSPRWLLSKGRVGHARQAMRSIGIEDRDAEEQLQSFASKSQGSNHEKLSWARHRRPILLVVSMAIFNQLSGINAILYYLNDILARSANGISTDMQAIFIGLTNGIFTLVGMALVDRLGRKTLLLAGAAGMSVCLGMAALSLTQLIPQFMLLWSVIGFIIFFAPTQGAVMWVWMSEVFPTPVRTRGSSLGASTHWFMNAVIAILFPVVSAWSPQAPFFFFCAVMVFSFFVILLFYPETKGVSLEQMENNLSKA